MTTLVNAYYNIIKHQFLALLKEEKNKMTKNAPPQSTSPQNDQSSKRHALIIEDNLVIRKTHSYLLNRYNFDVTEVNNGQEALEQINKHKPEFYSLFILDLLMPVMNGVEFILKIKEVYGEKLPPILVCSSKSEMPVLAKLQKLGVYGFVLKPVDQNKLTTKLLEIFPGLKKDKAIKPKPAKEKQNTNFTVKGKQS